MSLEIGLWRVDGAPERVALSSMPLEARLEELIEADPGILGTPLLLIGRQVRTEYGKFIDLLGLDAEGTLHILELKRDRTPREVVAQLLDYGSWVQDLSNEDIREIFAEYIRASGAGRDLDQAFAERFGASPPEALNTAHTLTVVAGEVDASTERIVTYLARRNVPINVMFFRYFEDQGRKYLARTWLMDEAVVTASAAESKGQGKKEPWNGQDWYVSFGEEGGVRSWLDARRYGFVSAGGGDWFSRTLRALPVGDRVFVHIPKVGYVGVGTVTREARPFDEAELVVDGSVRKMTDLELAAAYRHDHQPQDGQDRREWVVAVDWLKTVPHEDALWTAGMFANQNSACKLRARFTIDVATRYFGLD
ncbi:endonuclease NucS domain-containing protein [Actinomadura rifamycini]|uniref:endonuclease NucS domain-containing protein n=1 Tax=Actinomadura rifamycini TaxID=31962 RepID=UPI0004242DBC|nr:endonuclease NucS domain-containing protein [Actinomadura rifamycini]